MPHGQWEWVEPDHTCPRSCSCSVTRAMKSGAPINTSSKLSMQTQASTSGDTSGEPPPVCTHSPVTVHITYSHTVSEVRRHLQDKPQTQVHSQRSGHQPLFWFLPELPESCGRPSALHRSAHHRPSPAHTHRSASSQQMVQNQSSS